jgi:hypothetical protein
MLRSNRFFSGDLEGKQKLRHFPLAMPNEPARLFGAHVREPDQRHQDERDDIVTIALKPEMRLLKDRAA